MVNCRDCDDMRRRYRAGDRCRRLERTANSGGRRPAAREAVAGGFRFPVHPHVLRRACGFELADDGKDTRALQEQLGHGNVQHTGATLSSRPSGSRVSGRKGLKLPSETDWRF